MIIIIGFFLNSILLLNEVRNNQRQIKQRLYEL